MKFLDRSSWPRHIPQYREHVGLRDTRQQPRATGANTRHACFPWEDS